MFGGRSSDEAILTRQQKLAEANYRLLKGKRVHALSVIGAIGSGKTFLIERIIDRAKPCGLTVASSPGEPIQST